MVRRWKKATEGDGKRAETYERTLQKIKMMGEDSTLRKAWDLVRLEHGTEAETWCERWNEASSVRGGRSRDA